MQVEGHAVITTKIKCEAVRRGPGVEFVGELASHEKFNEKERLVVFL